MVGLYSPCMEAVDRVTSYRHFRSDRKQLLTQMNANKDIFQKWAKRVGISAEGLRDPHDTRLDDSNTANAVSQILMCIQDLFGDSKQESDKLHQSENQNMLSAPKRLCDPNVQSGPQSISRRRNKWAKTLHGKSKLEFQVLRFTGLVETLGRLVPPYGSFYDKDLSHQLQLMNFKGSRP